MANGFEIVHAAPPRCQREWRGPLNPERERVYRLEAVTIMPVFNAHDFIYGSAEMIESTRYFIPWPEVPNIFKREDILEAFAPYEGKLYDLPELINIELDDNGAFWDWLGDRLDMGSMNKVCSTMLAQMLLDYWKVWPFPAAWADNIHLPVAAFARHLRLVKPGHERVGDYICSIGHHEWYEFWMAFAYWRMRVKNRQMCPDMPKNWIGYKFTHVQQIITVEAV